MLNRDVSLGLQSLFSIKLLTGTRSESVPEPVMDLSHSGDIQLAPGDFYKVTGAKKTCLVSVSCKFFPVRVRKWKLFPSLPHDCAQNSTIYFLSLFTSSPLYWLLCTKSPIVTCTLTLAFQNARLWSSANTSN